MPAGLGAATGAPGCAAAASGWGAANGAPHSLQNISPGVADAPQLAHTTPCEAGDAGAAATDWGAGSGCAGAGSGCTGIGCGWGAGAAASAYRIDRKRWRRAERRYRTGALHDNLLSSKGVNSYLVRSVSFWVSLRSDNAVSWCRWPTSGRFVPDYSPLAARPRPDRSRPIPADAWRRRAAFASLRPRSHLGVVEGARCSL